MHFTKNLRNTKTDNRTLIKQMPHWVYEVFYEVRIEIVLLKVFDRLRLTNNVQTN